MSCEQNTIVKENLMDKVESMTVGQFQDAIEKAGLEGNSVIDSLVEQARQWRQAGTKGWVIRNRLGKMTSAGKVEKILQLTN